ncbi:membrane-bound alkaline phosphatase [Drosophila grimshawi]|uniref:Alkaline phosphatase n=1 Tax=Drosophila grimshawi TaxID=7222 RepID=B4J747_DROGR|nr:membrane-bound alkaline phosphatase [Drosophila grimshawi]EDW01035.1 GH20675 [Drosophila grimshawi]
MTKLYLSLVLLSALIATTWSAAFDMKEIHDQNQLVGISNAAGARINLLDPNAMAKNKYTPPKEKDAQFWYNLANEEIAKRLAQPQVDKRKAKNVIMFLGDGMSLTTVAAARILKGQLKGNTGEEDELSFEKFPYTGLSKTYCSNAQVPDSACTATAYLCGVKTNIVALGVTANVNFNNCSGSMDPANQVSSIATWAQAAGKATGIVTTTTLTHASPSGAYAHATNRFFESDTDIVTYGEGQNDPATCMDIATQLITQAPGKNFDVMLGGGMGKFLPKSVNDMFGNPGERSDGVNLLSKWQSLHPEGALAYNRAQLLSVDAKRIPRLIGLFNSGVMDFHKMADAATKPTLEELTKKAIEVVSQKDEGYFLFIEGGLIDYGNHFNVPQMGLDEVHELSKAVEAAVGMTNSDETLIVVTSDHAHPLSISGYPGRGTNILGLNNHDTDVNGVKYATLNYAVGTNPYLDENGKRENLEDKIDDPSFIYPSYITGTIGVHSGDDVGIFATGPQSHLFSGVMQQSTIPHLMAYASCIGKGPKLCDN